jgi:hypothetical protein
MRIVLWGAVTVLLAAGTAWAAAVNASNSNIKNLISKTTAVTGSTSLTGPGDTQTVFTTPAVGETLVTQFCGSTGAGGIRLDVAGLGGVAETGTGSSCVTFSPGVVVPANTAVTCTTSASATPGTVYFCSVNGLKSVK